MSYLLNIVNVMESKALALVYAYVRLRFGLQNHDRRFFIFHYMMNLGYNIILRIVCLLGIQAQITE
jgi:hypothetical protein